MFAAPPPPLRRVHRRAATPPRQIRRVLRGMPAAVASSALQSRRCIAFTTTRRLGSHGSKRWLATMLTGHRRSKRYLSHECEQLKPSRSALLVSYWSLAVFGAPTGFLTLATEVASITIRLLSRSHAMRALQLVMLAAVSRALLRAARPLRPTCARAPRSKGSDDLASLEKELSKTRQPLLQPSETGAHGRGKCTTRSREK